MLTCPSCGQENPPESRFCNACGAELAADEAAAREYRKVVTILFCDVVGSTALGESTDPEALRALLGRRREAQLELAQLALELRSRLPEFDSARDLAAAPVVAGEMSDPGL